MKENSLFRVRGWHTKRGFTVLLAALVVSIVLALGAAIFQLAQKQLILSSIGRDSQFAFYAADTAAECALYWDFRCNYFASSTSGINPACTIPDPPGPLCDGQALKPFDPDNRSTPPSYPYTMTSAKMNLFLDVAPFAGFCAQVSVTKCQGTIAADRTCTLDLTKSIIRTLIHADGYNVNCASILVSPRALQRTAEWRY